MSVKKTFVFSGWNFEERWGRGPDGKKGVAGRWVDDRRDLGDSRSPVKPPQVADSGKPGIKSELALVRDVPGGVRGGEVAFGDQIFLHGEDVDSGRPLVQIALDGHIAAAGSGVGR